MVLETQRLTLREMTQADFPALCKIMQDKDVMYAYEGIYSDGEIQEWLDRQLWRYNKYGFGLWAVVLKETGEMIGQCGLTMQDYDGGEVLEVGYLFQKAYWHCGYASEAAIACKQYAFDKLGAGEVYSIIRDTNTASQNVAIRNGMTCVAEFVKHFRGVDMPHRLYCAKRQRIVVAFPGTGYTCGEKLFAGCIDVYRERGYECAALDFSSIPFKQIETVEEAIEAAKPVMLEQLNGVCFERYSDVVFISKSLGTALAAWLAGEKRIAARQLFLTPIAQCLECAPDPASVIGMVIGTEDKVIDYRIVESFCAERGIDCLVVDNVGHSLKYDDEVKTQAINERIEKMCI